LKQSIFSGLTVVAFFVGVICTALAVYLYSAEQRLAKWSTTSATIQSIAIESEYQQRSGSSNQHAYWVVNVRYVYTVDSVQRTSNRLSNSPPQESLNIHAQPSQNLTQYLQRYAVGKQVNVQYDPSSPDKAFLEIKTGHARLFRIIAAVALIAGILLLVLRTRQ
jgi:branched-subunit amino acid ABC-type transport system permease component